MMKIFYNTIVILLLFTGCYQQCPKHIPGLDRLVNRYYVINYDYPLSLDELLSFCTSDSIYLQSQEDSLFISFLHLKQVKNKIEWIINDTLFPKQELTVLYGKDTLIHRFNTWRFPCLGFYNDAYVNCYLREPPSIDHFLSFCYYCDSVNNEEWSYDKCCDVTINNLKKCKQTKSFQWLDVDDDFFIVIDSDTIWHHNYPSPCNNEAIILFQPRFYDIKNQYVKVEENVYRRFKHDIREIWQPYGDQNRNERTDYQVLEFRSADGIHPFCDDCHIVLNAVFIKAMENYLKKFANEHEISRIVFVTPTIE